ncbi:MAG: hypothetical protein CMH22_06325 [Methylophaga sp.]|nr:hypothetical protein [Methylophaga sp.]|tara:strand:- start:22077 stop:23750 length:1674 start_codon:yes stop_codon:yes gene_type:complete
MGVKVTTKDFIEKAKIVHRDKYDYSKVVYVKSSQKVVVICKDHGEFEITPNKHLGGGDCQKCAAISRAKNKIKEASDRFVKESKETHGNKYDYSKADYKKAKKKVEIICKEHGSFWQTPDSHKGGNGCPKCGDKRSANAKLKSTEQFIQEAKEVNGDIYDYSKVNYTGQNGKVTLICPTHGEFKKEAYRHLQGEGCQKCSREKGSRTTEEFIEKSVELYGNLDSYDKVDYINSIKKVLIKCNKHNTYHETSPGNYLAGHRCPTCGLENSTNFQSKAELEIKNFISQYEKTKGSVKSLVKGSELDIVIKSKKLAVEYDGLYWHSDKFKPKKYHLDKTEKCLDLGYQLIHIFSDEWHNKKDIVKSRLKNIIGYNDNRIYARKCEIKEVDSKDSMKFLEENHIQGKLGGTYKIGLYYNDELVSLMTFGNLRKNMGRIKKEGVYELLRFCNLKNTSVIGGASKLLTYFEKNYQPKEIISYADLRWSKGDLYETLGFKLEHKTKPNYFYIKGKKRENRFKYRKSELVKEGFDKNKSEREIMEERGYSRIYDCGSLLYTKKLF